VEETLLHQNDQSRRIYYNMTPNAQVQSYFATMFIDEVDQNSCILHVSSCFDVAPDVADVDAVKSKFEATYEKALFNGLRAYFDK